MSANAAMASGMQATLVATQYGAGEEVEIWSQSHQQWLMGRIADVGQGQALAGGQILLPGVYLVEFQNPAAPEEWEHKFVDPTESDQVLRHVGALSPGPPAMSQAAISPPAGPVQYVYPGSAPGVATYTGSVVHAPGTPMAGTSMGFGSSPAVAAMSPGRINVSAEVFAKLAAGGSLTHEEMMQMSGQGGLASPEKQRVGASGASPGPMGASPGPMAASPGAAAGIAASPGSGKKDKKDKSSKKDKKDSASPSSKKEKKDGSKKALKGSKKKKEKGCC